AAHRSLRPYYRRQRRHRPRPRPRTPRARQPGHGLRARPGAPRRRPGRPARSPFLPGRHLPRRRPARARRRSRGGDGGSLRAGEQRRRATPAQLPRRRPGDGAARRAPEDRDQLDRFDYAHRVRAAAAATVAGGGGAQHLVGTRARPKAERPRLLRDEGGSPRLLDGIAVPDGAGRPQRLRVGSDPSHRRYRDDARSRESQDLAGAGRDRDRARDGGRPRGNPRRARQGPRPSESSRTIPCRPHHARRL
ncbi:MAG: oxidoreductase, short-chain dehydrogenase/reductase family, partial [uncultured Thermomicrobiales bacterium]